MADVPALTAGQKAAGRAFRDARQEWLASLDPPSARCSPHGPPFFRHDCPEGRSGTIAVALRERSEPSPAAGGVPAGFFRFNWLEGRCRPCGFTIRSGTGYVTVSEEENVG